MGKRGVEWTCGSIYFRRQPAGTNYVIRCVIKMKTLFIDESGDHNLEKIDSQYPVFVLAGVIFDNDYYNKTAKEKIKKFKIKIFGTDKIILHTADISRNKNGF